MHRFMRLSENARPKRQIVNKIVERNANLVQCQSVVCATWRYYLFSCYSQATVLVIALVVLM